MTPTSFTVSWTASTGIPTPVYVTNYRVLGSQTWIANPQGTIVSLTQSITGLIPATTYEIRVQASNTAGVAFSAVVQATTLAATQISQSVSVGIEWGAALAESPSNSTLTSTAGQIVDATGAVWNLVSGTGLQVNRNGAAAGFSANVILLLYFQHTVYQENSGLLWFSWNGSTWVATTDPRVVVLPPSESANNTSLTTTSGKIIDTLGVTWSLVSGTGLQVAQNGIADALTPNTTLLLYFGHTVYYRNSSNLWFRWGGSSWAGIASDPRNQTLVLGSAATITDNTGIVWGLVATNGGQVTRNGVVDTTTANVGQLVFINGVMWQFVPSTGLWYSWTGSTTPANILPGGSANPSIVAPLTATVAHTSFTYQPPVAGGTMSYILMLPANFDATKKYPLLMFYHADDDGIAFYNSGPAGDATAGGVKGKYATYFENNNFQTNFPCIFVAPLLDQRAQTFDPQINWGGYGNALDGHIAAIAIIKSIVANFPIDTTRIYSSGPSLGGTGTNVNLLLDNTINGSESPNIFAAGWALSGVDYEAATQTGAIYTIGASQVAQMQAGVALAAVHGASDPLQPSDRFSLPLFNQLGGVGGNAGGMPWTQAGTSNFFLEINAALAHDTWDTYLAWPKAQFYWNWLFSHTATGTLNPAWSAGTTVSPTGATRNPWDHPGGANSVWNTPMGAGATFGLITDLDTIDISRGWSGTAYTAGPVGIINSTTNFGNVYYIGKTTDPTFTFTATTNGRTVAPDNGTPMTATLHVPAGSISPGPLGGGDNNWILYDPVNQPTRQYFFDGITINPPGVQPAQGPFTGVRGEWDDATSDSYGEDFETGNSGFGKGAGMITGYDTDPTRNPIFPKIAHGLRYSTDFHLLKDNAVTAGTTAPLKPDSWPQRVQSAQSGTNVYSGNLKVGTTLAIPPSTAMPGGLTANQQGLFWSMQHYPSIFRNQDGGGFHYACDEVADTSAWMTDARAILPTFVALLRPVRNQHQAGQSFTTNPKNGPGVRSDIGPPPLAIPAPPVVIPPAGPVESAQGTFVATAGPIIYDATLEAFTLNDVLSGNPGTISVNGKVDTTTANVTGILYFNHTVWQVNTANNWYSKPNAAAAWVGPTTDPRVTTTTPPPVIVPTGTRSCYDQPGTNKCYWNTPFNSGAVWSSPADLDTQDLRHGGFINATNNFGAVFWVSTNPSDPIVHFDGHEENYNVAVPGSPVTIDAHVLPGSFAPGPYPGDQQYSFADNTSHPGMYYQASIGIQPGQIITGPYTGMDLFYGDAMTDTFGQDYDTGRSPLQAAGLIRGYDLDPTRNPARIPGTSLTRIQHKLRFATDPSFWKSNADPANKSFPNGTLNPSGFPNLYQDFQTPGVSVYTGHLLYPGVSGIPIGTPIPASIAAVDAGVQIWDCLQRYGCVGRDSAAGGFHLCADQNVSTAWITQANSVLQAIVQALCVLRNEHLGGQPLTTSPYGGPGTPLDTGPPPLAPLTIVTPPTTQESVDKTLISNTTGFIIDATGVRWALVASATQGQQITRGGVLDTTTANVTLLGYFNHTVYQQNAAGNWYAWSGVWTQVPDPRNGSTGNFSVFNGQIFDPSGNLFKAKGMNVYDSQQALVSTNALGQPLMSLFPGTTFIRLAVFQYSPVSFFTNFINQMTALKVVVLIDHHMGAGGGVPPLAGADLVAENNWWQTLAIAYKNNPYVWFDTLNEPAGPGPTLSAEQLSNYNTIRGAGNNNIILFQPLGDFSSGSLTFGTNGGANGLAWGQYTTMKNVGWDFHYYNWPTGYSPSVAVNVAMIQKLAGQIQLIRSADGLMPIVIGEYGPSTNGSTQDAGGAATITAVIQQAKTSAFVGCVAWAWKPGIADNLTDGANHLTPDFGVPVAAYIASP